MNYSNTDVSVTFFLDDDPSARTPASRLNSILQSVVAHRPLTVFQQELLRQRGYEALRQYALGELDMEAFRTKAQVEREGRLIVGTAADEKKVADERRRAEITDRKNAALFAQRERMLKRRKKKRELPDRFEQPFIERKHYQRVMRILRSVADGQPITKDDLVWLARKGNYYWTDKLSRAHHENMATILSDEWHQTKDVWKAINACKHWRKAAISEKGLCIAEEALAQASKTKKARSAILTTGGGAHRDLGHLEDAARFGNEAHSLTPDNFHPCTLLGAVHIEMRAYGEGAEWYKKAEARGASRNVIDRDLQAILNAAPQEERNQIKIALKAHDASRYGRL